MEEKIQDTIDVIVDDLAKHTNDYIRFYIKGLLTANELKAVVGAYMMGKIKSSKIKEVYESEVQ